jgi:hypothetical protein
VEHLERILWAVPPTVAELCLYLPVQLVSHLFAILGSCPGRDGVPALALHALSLCFVLDSDRSSAPAPAPTPFDPDALLGCAEGLRSLKLYSGRGCVNLLPPCPRASGSHASRAPARCTRIWSRRTFACLTWIRIHMCRIRTCSVSSGMCSW